MGGSTHPPIPKLKEAGPPSGVKEKLIDKLAMCVSIQFSLPDNSPILVGQGTAVSLKGCQGAQEGQVSSSVRTRPKDGADELFNMLSGGLGRELVIFHFSFVFSVQLPWECFGPFYFELGWLPAPLIRSPDGFILKPATLSPHPIPGLTPLEKSRGGEKKEANGQGPLYR